MYQVFYTSQKHYIEKFTDVFCLFEFSILRKCHLGSALQVYVVDYALAHGVSNKSQLILGAS